jgi:hypothetical protein
MKKSILILRVCLVLLVVFGSDILAQTPKEGTELFTTSYYGTSKIVPLGEGRAHTAYEAIGVTISDTGEGLFHGATVRVLGSMTIEKGVYNDDKFYGVFNLVNGDKVFFIGVTAGKAGDIGKGTATLIGGTGKCAGIQGSYEFTRNPLRPAIEGIGQSYTKAKIQYKLP